LPRTALARQRDELAAMITKPPGVEVLEEDVCAHALDPVGFNTGLL
jgi:hypothetical protein